MGCVNSKDKDQPAKGAHDSAKYTPPETVTTTTTTAMQPSAHQPISQQPSQHRISVSSGIGSHNGSIGYSQPLPPVPAPVMEDDVALYVARHAYQARTSEDLSFEKGEKLKVREGGGGGGRGTEEGGRGTEGGRWME